MDGRSEPISQQPDMDETITISRELLSSLVEALGVLTLGRDRNHRFCLATRAAKQYLEAVSSQCVDDDEQTPLEVLLTKIPFGWWVYDLSQDAAHMAWRCQLAGRVSGRVEAIYTAEHLTPRMAIEAAIEMLNQRFGHSE